MKIQLKNYLEVRFCGVCHLLERSYGILGCVVIMVLRSMSFEALFALDGGIWSSSFKTS